MNCGDVERFCDEFVRRFEAVARHAERLASDIVASPSTPTSGGFNDGRAVEWSDPTGNAACDHVDRAEEKRRKLEKLLPAMQTFLKALDGLGPIDEPAMPFDMENGCIHHAKFGLWAPRHRRSRLCRSCLREEEKRGSLPAERVLRVKHANSKQRLTATRRAEIDATDLKLDQVMLEDTDAT
jgi:hypothetical protein